jgi:hypothetical protein
MQSMKTMVVAVVVVVGMVGAGTLLFADPIHDAAKVNDTATLAALLKAQPSLINTPDANGWTPLHWAASEGRKEAVKLLLANGAEVNIQDKKGCRPVTQTILSVEPRSNRASSRKAICHE